MSSSIAYRALLGVALVCVVVGWSVLLSLGAPASAVEPTVPTETVATDEPTPTPSPEPTAVEPEPVVEPVGPYCAPPDTATPETTCYVRLTDGQAAKVSDAAAKVEVAAAVLVFFAAVHVVAGFGRYGRG